MPPSWRAAAADYGAPSQQIKPTSSTGDGTGALGARSRGCAEQLEGELQVANMQGVMAHHVQERVPDRQGRLAVVLLKQRVGDHLRWRGQRSVQVLLRAPRQQPLHVGKHDGIALLEVRQRAGAAKLRLPVPSAELPPDQRQQPELGGASHMGFELVEGIGLRQVEWLIQLLLTQPFELARHIAERLLQQKADGVQHRVHRFLRSVALAHYPSTQPTASQSSSARKASSRSPQARTSAWMASARCWSSQPCSSAMRLTPWKTPASTAAACRVSGSDPAAVSDALARVRTKPASCSRRRNSRPMYESPPLCARARSASASISASSGMAGPSRWVAKSGSRRPITPPGRRTRRSSCRARTGSARWQSSVWAKAASKEASGKGNS